MSPQIKHTLFNGNMKHIKITYTHIKYCSSNSPKCPICVLCSAQKT